ncbi:hypothetical protein AAF712_007270 [Marasmius tenuissimus]|uniref:Uncharacterized protein n=1 Tax=Marasmius tenuissimus TaxID=585030 RepID=A0ABR2ZXJ2_9AGAR
MPSTSSLSRPISPRSDDKEAVGAHTTARRKIFPFTLVLISVWVVYIVGLLWLLEEAVRHGTQSPNPHWALATLPNLLLTVFAQAHVPITGMHLSRIGVSALQYSSSAPKSWQELFWLADHKWEGPIGMVTSTLDSIRSRTRASLTFVLFAATCAIGLLNPIILTRAYQVRQVEVLENVQIRPSTTNFKRMQQVDGYTQAGVGMGSWATGTSVADIYNTSLFLPEGSSDMAGISFQPREFFFAGDVDNATATLPGLRLKGSCAPIDITSSGLDISNLTTSWRPFCLSRIPDYVGEPPAHQDFTGQSGFNNFSLSLCNNASWGLTFGKSDDEAQSENVGYVYYEFDYSLTNYSSRALIQCNSTLTTGTAVVSGRNRTFTAFSRQTLYNFSESTSAEPLLDPLFASFYILGDPKTRDGNFRQGSVIRGLGFQYLAGREGGTIMTPLDSTDISEGLWGSIAHSTGATGVLSRDSSLVFPAQVPRPVAVYTRNRTFAIGAYGLLILWLLLVLGITAWSFRRTFSGGLDSYVAAELVFREKDLLEGVPFGGMDGNQRLTAPFKALKICGGEVKEITIPESYCH